MLVASQASSEDAGEGETAEPATEVPGVLWWGGGSSVCAWGETVPDLGLR